MGISDQFKDKADKLKDESQKRMGNKDEMSDRSSSDRSSSDRPGGKDSAKDSAKNRGQQERDRMREERDEHEGNRGA